MLALRISRPVLENIRVFGGEKWERHRSLPSPVFHVTPASNIPSILRSGLQPRIGERSAIANEPEPAIYAFTTPEDVDAAFMGWLGESFEESVALSIIELKLPPWLEFSWTSDVGYEVKFTETIPPGCIKKIINEGDWETKGHK